MAAVSARAVALLRRAGPTAPLPAWIQARAITASTTVWQEAATSTPSVELPPNLILDDVSILQPPQTAAVPATHLATADLHFHERSTIPVRSLTDASATGETVTLDEHVFNAPLRTDIVHRVVRWNLAQGRPDHPGTKQRGEVAGSTRKMFPQKGRGAARVGMNMVPGRYGGPKAHGPRPKSWGYTLPRKVKHMGLRVLLSARAAEGRLHVVESLEDLASHKTAALLGALEAWGVAGGEGRAVFIAGEEVHPNLILAARNVTGLATATATDVTALTLMKHPHVFVSKDTLAALTLRLGGQ